MYNLVALAYIATRRGVLTERDRLDRTPVVLSRGDDGCERARQEPRIWRFARGFGRKRTPKYPGFG